MDSVLKLRNKEIMVIGGMIEQKMDNQDLGVPYVDSIPVVGNAFKKVDKTVSSVQTVIFLQATIVPGHGVDKSDQDFYRTFNNDPHPAEF
jgi:type II secretory pathway component GspD/PulD (secretin)